MRLIQYINESKTRSVGAVTTDGITPLIAINTTAQLAQKAIDERISIEVLAVSLLSDECLNYAEIVDQGRLLAPIDHPDDAHMLVTGTGLTHLGSANARNQMHAQNDDLTDSMKMFQMGLENGKPAAGELGVQPEWFYKGDGSIVAASDTDLVSPNFALEGSEEPEIAGVYLIGSNGVPYRLGYVLGNEFSDHLTERENYLFLAHSKLRPCAIGAELLLGELPKHVEGVSRLIREGEIVWQQSFLSGEDNMSHSLENLEHHHFKYSLFRRPGDLHLHFFGTATLSFCEGIKTREGDVFEIESKVFGRPLRNRLCVEKPSKPIKVRTL
ncbi:MAG: FAH family protein [Oceanospirillaceae bacterium]|nr:FAH family protein [Oceanospirillaceae bacterium]